LKLRISYRQFAKFYDLRKTLSPLWELNRRDGKETGTILRRRGGGFAGQIRREKQSLLNTPFGGHLSPASADGAADGSSRRL
jgi:hypothetical protein